MGDTVDFDSLDRVVNLVSKPTPTLTIKHIVKLTELFQFHKIIMVEGIDDSNNRNCHMHISGNHNLMVDSTILECVVYI